MAQASRDLWWTPAHLPPLGRTGQQAEMGSAARGRIASEFPLRLLNSEKCRKFDDGRDQLIDQARMQRRPISQRDRAAHEREGSTPRRDWWRDDALVCDGKLSASSQALDLGPVIGAEMLRLEIAQAADPLKCSVHGDVM